MKEYVIGSVDEIPDNGSVAVKAGHQVIAVFRTGESFYAIHNTCPHKGGLMCDGAFEPENKIVRCPIHLWGWRLDTGELETDPREKLLTYEVKVVDGEVILNA